VEVQMNVGKVIIYIVAAILIFFGVLFIWGAFSPQGQIGWIFIGLISVGIGFGLIWLAGRRKPALENNPQTTLKIDLPGTIALDKIKCQSCGGVLSSKDIELIAGAPMVSCPYCGTSYKLTEEPKW
jgi:hypothetical protein